ncbi:MAG: 3'(2'),5'-bisphosphate nucleotidase CysQ [Nitrosopumilaceae archaeon]|nr:3'(2'),5'-bisphosphate nucleotidase CysQ [Nitrosopumilaceae archaeon]
MTDIPIQNKLPELDMAINAVQKSGEAILKIYGGEFDSQTKKDDSPITIADLKSNEIIKSILTESGHKILSEEDKDDKKRLNEKIIWIVDPLDGTSDFIDKTGEFTIMIALVKNGKPILGVIGWPTGNKIFAAQKDCGAFRYHNNKWEKILVSDESDLASCRAVGSRHHLSETEKKFIEKLGITDFTSIGSSLKVAKISSGEADAYITTTNKMKEWDSAASHCIIHEAGGKMTDMSGNELSYNKEDVYHKNGILVTNGKIHEKIIEEFKKLE